MFATLIQATDPFSSLMGLLLFVTSHGVYQLLELNAASDAITIALVANRLEQSKFHLTEAQKKINPTYPSLKAGS